MEKLLSKQSIVAIIIVATLVGGALFLFSGDEESSYDTIVAGRENLIQEINATGRVEAVESIDLAFENTGRVAKTYVSVGDRVTAGQLLVTLENSEERAKIAQAEAALAKDTAKLAELTRGVRPEEIQVQEVKVVNAQSALEDAKRNFVDTVQDAYTRADDAVRNKTDQLFSNPRTSNPQLSFAISFQEEISIESKKVLVEQVLQTWSTSLESLTTAGDLDFFSNEASQNLIQIRAFLDKMGSVVNNLTDQPYVTKTTIDAWKVDVSAGRTSVNTAIANLTAAEEKLKTAMSNLSLGEQELALKKSGTIEEQITAQEAQIKESEANVQYYQAQLSKSIIRSPIDGIVTVQDAKVGAIVSANTVMVAVISEGKYQVEAFVVEADIANLKVGDAATLSLDAYGEDLIFEATVIKINPAAEFIEGVASYKTTLQLHEGNGRIRVGMTADVDIITALRDNVVVIPQRAVIFKDQLKIVRILNEDGSFRETQVETGITGRRGGIEIISGIREGDVVVTAIRN